MTDYLTRFKNLLAVLAHVWEDRRVPFVARMFLVLAPIYLLFPYDINPDFLPGGFTDDLSVMPVLVGFAFALIPSGVFKDAKRAAATRAVCGIMCLSFSTNVIANFNFNVTSKTHVSKAHNAMAVQVSASKHSLSCIGAGNLIASFTHDGQLCRSGEIAPLAANLVLALQGKTREQLKTACESLKLAFCRSTDTILVNRGGQYQLYAADHTRPGSCLAKIPQDSMPPQLAGGIFIDNPIKFLSRKGARC
jgi:uncharacterized membrane protein YkvA (DUF1232 family)